jgi:predicted nucleotidyltransferase
VILFGSKARGDAGDDADIDLLVIVETADWARKGQIRLIDARVSLEYDVLLNTHILDPARWAELAQHQATLWREVQRDGDLIHQEIEA